jgi:hypothetical protein
MQAREVRKIHVAAQIEMAVRDHSIGSINPVSS